MQMNIPFQLSDEFVTAYENTLMELTRQVIAKAHSENGYKPYMNKKEAAQYIGISFNTFQRLERMGLPVIDVDGIKLVKKEDIDLFLENYK